MKFVFWLWNPWLKYQKTRHNVGFLFLDYIVSKNNSFQEFKLENKFKAFVACWFINWEKTFLIKPFTYMNLSWESISYVINFYKISVEDIIIIYDDINIDFGKIKFSSSWASWWQNGIKSIIKNIWEKFKRIKIWIWLDDKYEISDWVLSKFKTNDIKLLENKIFSEVFDKMYNNLN